MIMEKNEIRKKVKALRVMLSDLEKRSAAEEVFARLEKTAAFILADRILMYHSLPDEVFTHDFLSKWHGRKHFFLPRVNGVNLDILPYEESRLELGSFHIEDLGRQRGGSFRNRIDCGAAVAYDRKGNRLGRGKGFYDRLLGTTKATKVGIGYEFQLLDELPVEPHDVGVDIIITQNSTIVINGSL